MILEISPNYDLLCDRLRFTAWFSRVGYSTPLELPFPCRFVSDGIKAIELIEGHEWEDWTLERRNDVTSFLHARFINRYAGRWNKIANKAVGFLATEIEPKIVEALAKALPNSVVAVDAVRWDLVSALMEAAYADCRPPQFFTNLLAVYESGHLPVGWDAESSTLLIY